MKANWLPVSRHWDFPQISEEQENWRTATERSSTESRAPLQRCFGSVGTELNCQTSSFLDLPLKIYSASLGFCKICLTKGRRNCRGVSLLWIVHRKSGQEQNNKRLQVGLGITELLNDCSINMFSDGLRHDLCLFCFVEFVSTQRRRVCLSLQLISLGAWHGASFIFVN